MKQCQECGSDIYNGNICNVCLEVAVRADIRIKEQQNALDYLRSFTVKMLNKETELFYSMLNKRYFQWQSPVVLEKETWKVESSIQNEG